MDADVLHHLPPWLHGSLTPLSGGLTNRSYRLTTGQGRYWLRWGCPHPQELGIDRRHERIAHQAAAEAGLAPAMRYCDPRSGASWCWTGSTSRTGDNGRERWPA
ncbi:hypothetical protein MBH78_20205 [Oceanimonas sp. NS1]|nr:hypothetical protein [Oceanimonas sp. NS1]